MNEVQRFWNEQGEWSQKTFGLDKERGPLGSLKHLEKEAREAQNAVSLAVDRGGDFLERVEVEIADCLFLTFDAARRAGMSLDSLIDTCFRKLEINKTRKWGVSKPGEAVEHIREKHETN
jgi:hypothetical protein